MVRTKRQWKPNIQKVSFYENGKRQSKKVCTRCLRTLGKR
jgi:ribosomal protein L28